MIVEIGHHEARLREVGTLSELRVDTRGADADAVDRVLRRCGAGFAADEHGWIRCAWLRAHGERTGDWIDAFNAMIEYARSRGWVDDATETVRAHLT